jgi:YD repeat-containing protein
MNALSSRVGGRWLLMLLVVVAAGYLGLALEGSSSAAEDSAPQGAADGHGTLRDALDGAVPVASMATETSKTYRRPDGTFITRVFAQRADAAADIDATPNGFAATAGDVEASFPETLAGPLRIGQGDDWVSLQLRDGAGQARADDSSITYDNALPGADVEYTVSSGAVGEEIHLTGDQAPSTYVFDVRASNGIHAAKQPNGTIALTNADGHRVFGLSPSYAYADRSARDTEPVDTDLDVVDSGWRITLSVDPAWLHDALAGGPVTIDPTVYLNGATRDCGLSAATPSLSYCANGQLWVGYNGIADNHTLVKWDLSAIPKDAVALWGDASLYQAGAAPANAKSLTLHRLTRDWTSGASWSTYDGIHSWTTAGGDFDATPAASAPVPAGHTGWTDWMITPLVQHWIDGSQPNYGVAVQDKPGPQVTGQENFYATEGTTPDQAPELDIAWSPRTGSLDAYTLEGQSLDAKTTAQLNVANGNLLLTTNDINAPGNGLDFRFDHYYNSLLDGNDSAALGVRTTASLGRDLRLRLYYGDVVSFERGDGVRAPFIDPVTTGSTTTWTAPYELSNATLSRNNTTNNYTLRLPTGLPSQPGKDLTLSFDNTGKLATIADQDANVIALSYYPGGDVEWPTLHGITDNNDAAWTVDKGSLDEERIADIVSPDNHHTTFNYLTSGRYLNQITEADGTTNTYGYDSSKRITSITTPDGNVTKITYNGSSSKVASLIRTTNPAHTTGPTTTISYSSPSAPCQSTNFDYTKNVVSRPDGSSTTYCANDHAQITYDTDGPASATPSGQWYDLHDQYTNGAGTPTVTLGGSDAGSGIASLNLEEVGGATLATYAVPCNPRDALRPVACPHDAAGIPTVATAGLTEGAHDFRERVVDFAGNAKVSDVWTVRIDRTAPTAASGFDAQRDPDDDVTYIDWDPGDDPTLPDGTPGSGVSNEFVRFQRADNSWSPWQNATTSDARASGFSVGDSVTMETYEQDRAGNTSFISSEQVEVTALQSEDDDWEAVWDDGSTGQRNVAPSAALKKSCAMSGQDPKRTDRSGETNVNIQAFATFSCPLDPTLQYIQVTICITYLDDDNEWHPVIGDESDSDDDAGCVSQRRKFSLPPVSAEFNALCRPGTHDYRAKLHAKVALYVRKDIHIRKTLNSSDLNCNEDGAWRVLANENVPKPSDTLGRALNLADDHAPAAGFAAHHIVPASYGSRAADAQGIAYSCGFEPNAAPNGVWLRGPKLRKQGDGNPPATVNSTAYNNLPQDGKDRAYHPSIHTIRYFDWVADELRKDGTFFGNSQCHNQTADAVLRSIKTDLEHDNAPYKPNDPDPVLSTD